MKKQVYLVALLFAATLSIAQKQLTMEEAVLGGRNKLAPKKLFGLQFIPGTAEYSFVDNTSGKETVVRSSADKAEKNVVMTAEEVKTAIKNAGGSERLWLPMLKWKNTSAFTLTAGENVYEINTQNKTAKFVEKDFSAYENADRCEANGLAAFTKENNLFISDKGTETAVSNETNKNILFGASNVHRNEFGVSKGTFWSPTGNYLAFYRMDQTMVNDYPVVNWTDVPAKEKIIKYPMAGGTSHQVTLGVYDVKNKTTVYLKTEGPDDHYLTNIAWSPDEKTIYIAELNRDQNHMKLNAYDAKSGAFQRTLFEEKEEKYVEPMNPMLFVKNNPGSFIWQSRRDGYNHLYLYDVMGKSVRQLTQGNWEVIDVTGFDEKGTKLFFHANVSGAINKDFCSVTIKDAKFQRITSGEGTHNCFTDEKGMYVLDEFTSLDVPRVYNSISVKSGKTLELMKAENPLKEFALGKVKLFTIKNKEGTDLWCRMYLPVNFDSTKKYPVVVYLYGGPHHKEINNTFNGSGNLWYQYMAERGYIVFSLDNRGTEHRGKAFEQATFRNLGTTEMEDQLAGVDYLKTLKYVDANRMGVHGWSFGGFMTTSLMTRKPGTFKVGVGGGPVIDWSMYEVMYTERYMDTPQKNPEGFKQSSLFQYIPNLKGKLLLIHGTDDDVVVWQHSLKYIKTCVDKGVQLDYFVYPGHLHNVLGKDRVHLMQKITDYFVDHL